MKISTKIMILITIALILTAGFNWRNGYLAVKQKRGNGYLQYRNAGSCQSGVHANCGKSTDQKGSRGCLADEKGISQGPRFKP